MYAKVKQTPVMLHNSSPPCTVLVAAFLEDLTKHMSTQQNGDIFSEQIAFSLFDTGKDNSSGMLTQARKTHVPTKGPG